MRIRTRCLGLALLALAVFVACDTASEDTGSGDDAGADAMVAADAAPEVTAPAEDPLTCTAVDYGYGDVWDGSVNSPSEGPEPAPLTGITEAHNAVRRYVGVPEFSWSSALAEDAQVWADHLRDTMDCDMQHDHGSGEGENLAAAMWMGPMGGLSPQDVVGMWSCEREDWDNAAKTCIGVDGFGEFPRSCGHYTQVVWESSAEVGCAMASCDSGSMKKQIWVCRYTPPGNWLGERPYPEPDSL